MPSSKRLGGGGGGKEGWHVLGLGNLCWTVLRPWHKIFSITDIYIKALWVGRGGGGGRFATPLAS